MIKVTILMTTYNHEKYIATAIDSIIRQGTSECFEVLIGDDCSTDNTALILKEYRDLYPEKIKLVLREKNIGPIQNFVDLLSRAKGEYISLLEGDDYWESPDKLDKAISFLDENLDYIGTFHDIHVIDAHNKYNVHHEYHNFSRFSDVNSLDEHFAGKMMMTLSMVFRNIFLDRSNIIKLCEILNGVRFVGDYSLKALLLSKGKFRYLKGVWGAYRHITTHGSSWSAQAQYIKDDDFLIIYRNSIRAYGQPAEKFIDAPYVRLFFKSLYMSLAIKNFRRFLRILHSFDYKTFIRRNIYLKLWDKLWLGSHLIFKRD